MNGSAGSRGKVLLVDDSPLLLTLLRRRLEALGLEVREAGELEAARALLRRERVDLVLLEMLQASDNGFRQGLELLRAGSPPLVLMTASGRDTDREWAERLGFAAVLRRPCGRDALLQALEAGGLRLEPAG